MRIHDYSYSDDPTIEDGWKMSPVRFGSLNLIVGISGSGKTRLLNTISNIASTVKGKATKTGSWDLILEQGGLLYEWKLFVRPMKDEPHQFEYEYLSIIDGSEKFELIKRHGTELIYKNDKLPKLPKDESAVSLLKEENSIKPLYEGFDYFVRREFSIESLTEAAQKHIINFNTKESFEVDRDIKKLIRMEGLSDRLQIIKKSYQDIYEEICEFFINTFPFVKRVDIKNLKSPFGLVPIFCIKERNVDKWIPLEQMSSGMQKILFMLTDICSLPEGSVYFIDEYENSLGINAINFLPEFLSNHQDKVQFFITSHHPYLINNIPVINWYLCYRQGQNVLIKFGKELIERYGESKQKAFINLINDTIYSEGAE